ncbi:hypothetical protein KXD40_000739 [Peronospora effusa]|nr:hypothetical protein KXD40_000739 [Peronospora effusa]
MGDGPLWAKIENPEYQSHRHDTPHSKPLSVDGGGFTLFSLSSSVIGDNCRTPFDHGDTIGTGVRRSISTEWLAGANIDEDERDSDGFGTTLSFVLDSALLLLKLSRLPFSTELTAIEPESLCSSLPKLELEFKDAVSGDGAKLTLRLAPVPSSIKVATDPVEVDLISEEFSIVPIGMLPFDKDVDPVNEPADSLISTSAAGTEVGVGGLSDPSAADPGPEVGVGGLSDPSAADPGPEVGVGGLSDPSAADPGPEVGVGGLSDLSAADPGPEVSADETSSTNPPLSLQSEPIVHSGVGVRGVGITTKGEYVGPDSLDELDSERVSEAAVSIVEISVLAVETGTTEKGT